jgi:hypothetical protein
LAGEGSDKPDMAAKGIEIIEQFLATLAPMNGNGIAATVDSDDLNAIRNGRYKALGSVGLQFGHNDSS